jgi:bacteriocin biosynthesis cyclodehydratase domain-containing protein
MAAAAAPAAVVAAAAPTSGTSRGNEVGGRPRLIRALPYLAPWHRIATCDDKVVIEYGQRIVCLEGRAATVLLPVLLPLLDGTRTLDEIVAILGEPARPAIEATLERLEEHELLLDGPPLADDVPPSAASTAELLASLRPGEVAPRDVISSLGSQVVALVGSGSAADAISRLLRQSGVDVRRGETFATGLDLVVCAPAPAQLPMLGEWNHLALETRQAWLQMLPFDGRYASIGPLYIPHETCCFDCFRLRRVANLDAADELTLLDATPGAYPVAPGVDALVAGIATILVLEWLAHRNDYVPSAFYAVELVPEIRLTLHHVHRVPRCGACSGLADVSTPLPWHTDAPIAHA